MREVEIGVVTVGEELVTGRVVDTHSSYLARKLTAAGYHVPLHASVGDRSGELSGFLGSHGDRAAHWIVVGGLGPTEDDRTRDELAVAAGLGLEFREDAWKEIVRYFERLGRPVVETNRKQAYFPSSAESITNPVGTAPAFRVSAPGGRGSWWALPGVPAELYELFEATVLPRLLAESPPGLANELLAYRFFAVAEAKLDGWLLERIPTDRHDSVHVCVTDGEIDVRIPAEFEVAEAAAARFGPRFLGPGDDPLAARIVAQARASGRRIALAESITGGLISARLTGVPGASEALAAGWVVYTAESKQRELGVDPALLDRDGTVGPEISLALARGARERAGVDIGLGITGWAGPEAPAGQLGRVVIAVATRGGLEARREFSFRGGRDRVRSFAANHGLFALWCALTDADFVDWDM